MAENIIISNPDKFEQSDFVTDFLRVIGWKAIKGLRALAKGVETLLDAVYDFLNITNSEVFQNYYNNFRPLIVVGLVVSLISLGLIYMLSEKRPEVLKNFIVGLMVVFAAPTFIQYFNDAIFTSKAFLTSNLSSTDSVISSNITDLLYLDSTGWDFTSGSGNTLDEGAITHLNPSEHVNKKSDVSSLGQEIFDTQIIVKANGKIKYGEMGVKGWFDIFDPPYYYRYSINYFQIAILLIIFMLVIIFASYKSFLLIYEIMNSRIIGSLVAMDLTSGQKVKKVIEGFFSAYFSLFYILVSLKLYAITQSYINAQSYGPIIRTFMLLFAGFLVMDGPNLIEKIFGYDIGFGSGAQKFMSLMRLGLEGMQLKQYAQNMGFGGGGKGPSNIASDINDKKTAFSNSRRSEAPEPSTKSEGTSAYSAQEPNTSPNDGQNNNYSSSRENQSTDVPNNSDNNGQYSENGTPNLSSEPPMSESGQSSSNMESNEYMNNNSGNSTGYSNEDISTSQNTDLDNGLSNAGSSDFSNDADAALQEPDQSNDENMGASETHNSTVPNSGESNASSANNSTQDFSSSGSERGNEVPGNISNNTNSSGSDKGSHSSSSQDGSKEPDHGYNQVNSTLHSDNELQRGESDSSKFSDTNGNVANNRGEKYANTHSPDIDKKGATNSTSNNNSSSTYQNGHENAIREQLMDKKFGTESISPNIISSHTEEPGFGSDGRGGKNNFDEPSSNLQSNGLVQDDNGSKYDSENDASSPKEKPKGEGTEVQNNADMTPSNHKGTGSVPYKDTTQPSGVTAQDNAGTAYSDHKGSNSAPHKDTLQPGAVAQDNDDMTPIDHKGGRSASHKDSLQPGGAVLQDNIGATSADHGTIASNNSSSQKGINDTNNDNSSAPEDIRLPNKNTQSDSLIPNENLNEGSNNIGGSVPVPSGANLKVSDALLNNNVPKNAEEPGAKLAGNGRNLNVTDVLNTPTPELPKGSKTKKTTGTRKTGKNSTDNSNKGVSKKK